MTFYFLILLGGQIVTYLVVWPSQYAPSNVTRQQCMTSVPEGLDNLYASNVTITTQYIVWYCSKTARKQIYTTIATVVPKAVIQTGTALCVHIKMPDKGI